jgi:hypothetical protein
MEPLKLNRVAFRHGMIVLAIVMGSSMSTRDTETVLAAGGVGLQAGAAPVPANHDDTTIRPFKVHVPEETLVDLRRRLSATR